MSIDDKSTARDKLRFVAKEVLPLYGDSSTTTSKFPDRKKILSWLEAINPKALSESDLILFLEIVMFVNTPGYPNVNQVLEANQRPEMGSQSFGASLKNLEKKFYDTPFTQFCYHLSILQKCLKYLEQARDSQHRVVNRFEGIFLDFQLELLLVNFYQVNQANFAHRHALLATGDFDAINTVLILEIETRLYHLAQKEKLPVYGAETDQQGGEFVVKQILPPEVVLNQLLKVDGLAGYQILFTAILAILYDPNYYLLLERRYLQALNTKFPMADVYFTGILMVFVASLDYLLTTN